MPGAFNWTSATLISFTNSGPSVANNSATLVSATFDNRLTGNGSGALYMHLYLCASFAVAPSAGVAIECYFVPALNGVSFAETATNSFQPTTFKAQFTVLKNSLVKQTLLAADIPLSPFLYNVYFLNKTAQTMAAGWSTVGAIWNGQYT